MKINLKKKQLYIRFFRLIDFCRLLLLILGANITDTATVKESATAFSSSDRCKVSFNKSAV